MRTFRVLVIQQISKYGSIDVQARNAREAKELVLNMKEDRLESGVDWGDEIKGELIVDDNPTSV